MSEADELLYAKDVAGMIGMSEDWVYAQSRKWVASNHREGIPTVPLGRKYRYRPSAIAEWIVQLERGEAKV